jgi:SAM-dependent methyltransferase
MAGSYPQEFYERLSTGSLSAAEHILPLLWQKHRFRSVIDIGCGAGAWLRVSERLGAERICGVDGSGVPDDLLLVNKNSLLIGDLEKSIAIAERFDLCICLEVAEHLSPSRAAGLVQDLVRLSDIVLFSAAIPFQGGNHHVNEQWPEFWASLFYEQGFEIWDGIRKEIWKERVIPWWYRQNVLLFLKKSRWAEILPGVSPTDPNNLAMVHPECFLWNKGGDSSGTALLALYRHWDATALSL